MKSLSPVYKSPDFKARFASNSTLIISYISLKFIYARAPDYMHGERKRTSKRTLRSGLRSVGDQKKTVWNVYLNLGRKEWMPKPRIMAIRTGACVSGFIFIRLFTVQKETTINEINTAYFKQRVGGKFWWRVFKINEHSNKNIGAIS
jgi:hypothetical protein